MATSGQVKTSRKMLAIVGAILIGTFFTPPLPAVPVEGQINAAGSLVFERILVRGDELVLYAPAPGATCAEAGSGWGYGGSVVAKSFAREQVIDGKRYVPVAAFAGQVGGTKRVFSCSKTDIRLTQSFIFTDSNLMIIRAALGLLVAVYGYYVILAVARPSAIRESDKKPKRGKKGS